MSVDSFSSVQQQTLQAFRSRPVLLLPGVVGDTFAVLLSAWSLLVCGDAPALRAPFPSRVVALVEQSLPVLGLTPLVAVLQRVTTDGQSIWSPCPLQYRPTD